MSERISFLRTTGRTTRIIDAAIQTLFEAGIVKIIDHDYDFRVADHHNNRSVMDRVLRRLKMEHPRIYNQIDIDSKTCTLRLRGIKTKV